MKLASGVNEAIKQNLIQIHTGAGNSGSFCTVTPNKSTPHALSVVQFSKKSVRVYQIIDMKEKNAN